MSSVKAGTWAGDAKGPFDQRTLGTVHFPSFQKYLIVAAIFGRSVFLPSVLRFPSLNLKALCLMYICSTEGIIFVSQVCALSNRIICSLESDTVGDGEIVSDHES